MTVDYYNALNQEIETASPGSLTPTTMTYDNNGNLYTKTTGGGTTTKRL